LEDNIEIGIRKIKFGYVNCIRLDKDRLQ
jgi:hypothetical protein